MKKSTRYRRKRLRGKALDVYMDYLHLKFERWLQTHPKGCECPTHRLTREESK